MKARHPFSDPTQNRLAHRVSPIAAVVTLLALSWPIQPVQAAPAVQDPCVERCQALAYMGGGVPGSTSCEIGTNPTVYATISLAVNLDSGDCDLSDAQPPKCLQDQGCEFTPTTTWTNCKPNTSLSECYKLDLSARQCVDPPTTTGPNGNGSSTGGTIMLDCLGVNNLLFVSSADANCLVSPQKLSVQVSVECTSCQ